MSEPTWAQRKSWNNDGMDPDWVSSRHNKSEVEKLKLENQRLREALEYYADPRKKQQDDDWGDWYDNGVLKLVTGRRARAALESSSD